MTEYKLDSGDDSGKCMGDPGSGDHVHCSSSDGGGNDGGSPDYIDLPILDDIRRPLGDLEGGELNFTPKTLAPRMSMYTSFDNITATVEIFNAESGLYCHEGHCNNVTVNESGGNLTVEATELTSPGDKYYDIYDDFDTVDQDVYNETWEHLYDPQNSSITVG